MHGLRADESAGTPWECVYGHILDTIFYKVTKMWPKCDQNFGHILGNLWTCLNVSIIWPKYDQNFGHILGNLWTNFLFISTTARIVQERRNLKVFTNSKHLSYIYSSPAEVQSNTRWPIRSVTTFCWLWFGSSETNSSQQKTKYVIWPDGSPCMLLRYVVHLLFLYPTLP